MKLKNNGMILSILGLASLLLATLIKEFANGFLPMDTLNFIEGFFFGLSLVLNMAFLIIYSMKKKILPPLN